MSRSGLLRVPRGVSHALAFCLFAACSSDSGTGVTTPDTTPPTVGLSLSSSSVTSPGDITLTATADDAVGVTKVEFYEQMVGLETMPIKIGEDVTQPYEFARPVVSDVENGDYEFSARAYDAAGNVGTSAVQTASVSLGPTPPAFTISASHDRITTPGQITFTESSGAGLVRLEIYDRGRKVGETSGSPTSQVAIDVTAADNGSRSYVAKGFKAAGVLGFSNPVTVQVDIGWDLLATMDGILQAGSVPLAGDATGALYLAGATQKGTEAAPKWDAFLVKYDADGKELWRQTLATADFQQASSVAVDPSGRVYLTGVGYHPGDPGDTCSVRVYDAGGSIERTFEHGGNYCFGATDAGADFYLAQHAGNIDVAVTKYNQAGAELWSRQFGSAPGATNDDILTSIVADPLGDVYVGGYTSGSMDGRPNRGGRDAFVVKFDGAGNRLWSSQFGTPDHDFATSLAADPEGGVYVGGGKDNQNIRFGQYGDAFVARLGPDGQVRWVHYLDGGYYEQGWAVAAGRGTVYLVGETVGSSGPPYELSEPSQGEGDAFLARLSRGGQLQSVRLLGGPQYDYATGVVIGQQGSVYMSLGTEGGLAGAANPGLLLARLHELTP